MGKILFVGDLFYGSTGLQRMNALKELDNDIHFVDSTYKFNKVTSFLFKIFYTLGFYLDVNSVNRYIIECLKKTNIDLVWVDKALMVSSKTLKKAKCINKSIKIIYYSPDNIINKKNQSKHLLGALPLFDVVITTKSYTLSDLKNIGAQHVLFIDNCYDPKTHFPVALDDTDKIYFLCDLSFIGSYEKERAEMILHLCSNGFKVRVYGADWKILSDRISNLHVVSKPFWGIEYSKVISGTKVNLCFLKKSMGDLQTTRSLEIPACGGFMLAERTVEHCRLFKEDIEAVFFESKEELLQKVKYYLADDSTRQQIAQNGFIRVSHSGYSYTSRFKKILSDITIREKTTDI